MISCIRQFFYIKLDEFDYVKCAQTFLAVFVFPPFRTVACV